MNHVYMMSLRIIGFFLLMVVAGFVLADLNLFG